MAYQKQKKNWEEQRERKRKEREAFANLSSPEKIERLMKYIDELEQNLEEQRGEDIVRVLMLQESIEKRFRAVYNLLRSAEARDDQLEELASLRAFGPVDMECPDCHHRTVRREKSWSDPLLKYKLECLSCGWSQEFKWES